MKMKKEPKPLTDSDDLTSLHDTTLCLTESFK